MKLAKSSLISEIDLYARDVLGIPTRQLIERSGKAVSRVVKDMTPRGETVIFFAGKGNNGADGYAAAWVYIPLIIAGLATGILSMVKLIITSMSNLERLERGRAERNGGK